MSSTLEPCDCGGPECMGPEPVPWLSWKHCFRMYEFRYGAIPIGNQGGGIAVRERLPIRIRYEHALCLLGRKQGPIVHSLTLLPKEEVKIYEFDRYRRSTSATSRFSVRSSFFTMTQRVQDAYSSTKVNAGSSVSTSSSASAEGGGGIDLGIVSFGGGASVRAAFARTLTSTSQTFRRSSATWRRRVLKQSRPSAASSSARSRTRRAFNPLRERCVTTTNAAR